MSRFFESEASASSSKKGYRNWVFTLNNYTENERTRIECVVASECKYVCYQPEIGSGGTQHLQGVVLFKNQRNLDGVRRLFGGSKSGGLRRRGVVGGDVDNGEGVNGLRQGELSTSGEISPVVDSSRSIGGQQVVGRGDVRHRDTSREEAQVDGDGLRVGACDPRESGRSGCRFHFEPMRGTADQAIAYCCKEETRDANASFGFIEFGVRPIGQGGRSDLSSLVASIKDGKRGRDLFEEHAGEFIKYTRGIDKACSLYDPVRAVPTQVFWYYGPTGCGKSRAALEEGGADAYWKNPTDYWWDGYSDQRCVIIDDYRKDFCKFSDLLRLFDRYPLRLNVKGSTVSFTAAVIIVTSPKSPEETWEGRTEEDLEQLMRRIFLVKHFPKL